MTGIYDEFAAAFSKAVHGLQVGNGLEAGVTQVRIQHQVMLEIVDISLT
jgi:hypothetical protein